MSERFETEGVADEETLDQVSGGPSSREIERTRQAIDYCQIHQGGDLSDMGHDMKMMFVIYELECVLDGTVGLSVPVDTLKEMRDNQPQYWGNAWAADVLRILGY